MITEAFRSLGAWAWIILGVVLIGIELVAPGDDGVLGTVAGYEVRYLVGDVITEANFATAHLVTGVGADPQAVLAGAQSTLREVHGIEHATLQVEVTPARECREATW